MTAFKTEALGILKKIEMKERKVLHKFAGDYGKDYLRRILYENVYSYPSVGTRRYESGGMLDYSCINTYEEYSAGNSVLMMEDDAPSQHPMNSSLDDFIEGGFRNVPPRPFYGDAEDKISQEMDEYINLELSSI